VRALASFHDKQFQVFDGLGELALRMWEMSWLVFLP
jgi:hypothetical protein